MVAVRESEVASAGDAADAAGPAHRSFTGLLPRRFTRWRRPRWYQEIAIIAIGYWLYSLVRNAIPEHESIATRHARSIQHVQDVLHLNFERSFNGFVAAHEWLAQPLNYYYATLHFIVTPGVLIWLFVKFSHLYRGVRTVLFATTLIALAGFALYPLAPPRLMPEFGYVDTLVVFHTWGSFASPAVQSASNQFAAMPSLHIGWALWAGITIVRLARRRWVRVLGAVYPLGTLVVIVGTANHFLLDAVGGAVVVAAGFGVQFLLSGRGAFTAPVDAPDFGRPDPPLPGHKSA
ncbi:phosphatase PAP2 family protein [Jatrophihabitans fulvus]